MDPLKMDKNNILMYHGPMSIQLLSFVGNYLKGLINMVDYRVVTRIYKIFFELAQNISYYSAEKRKHSTGVESGIGWFNLKEENDCYVITTGNPIRTQDAPILKDYCNEINGLNEEELRELKRQTRGKADIKDVGAHIGLIQTGILSGNNIEYAINTDGDNASFVIHVSVSKN